MQAGSQYTKQVSENETEILTVTEVGTDEQGRQYLVTTLHIGTESGANFVCKMVTNPTMFARTIVDMVQVN